MKKWWRLESQIVKVVADGFDVYIGEAGIDDDNDDENNIEEAIAGSIDQAWTWEHSFS